jgi:hypothetical protein
MATLTYYGNKMKKENTYKVVWRDKFGFERTHLCVDLASAIEYNKTLNKPGTTICGNGMEIIGTMGVDSIEDGLCPDGVEYSWRKRR